MLLTTELANSLAALISGAMARKHKGEDKNRMEDLGSQWKLVVLSDRLAIPDIRSLSGRRRPRSHDRRDGSRRGCVGLAWGRRQKGPECCHVVLEDGWS